MLVTALSASVPAPVGGAIVHRLSSEPCTKLLVLWFTTLLFIALPYAVLPLMKQRTILKTKTLQPLILEGDPDFFVIEKQPFPP